MYALNRIKIAVASFILVLAVSALAVQPALADSSTPPPPAPSTGSGPAAPTGNNSPSKVPAGTDVVVLDKSGNSVPLASQKAAHIVAAGDPLWCPAGVAPKPSAGGCSPAYTGFNDLQTWLYANDKPKAGAIWIAGSYQGSVNDPGITYFTLDGSTLTNMSNHSLDINGGWSGTSGSKTINTNSPSVFNSSLSILNWHAPITISDIVMTGVSVNPNDNYALSVLTDKGGITLNRVQVKDNYYLNIGGAHLDTTAATLGHPAPVTVNDSVFNNNYGDGLYIQSDGAVNIRNLTADNNGGALSAYGAYIDNWWNNPNQPVTLSGTNEFKRNYGDGLRINSYGVVTLNNITAYHNIYGGSSGYGVFINNNHDSTPSTVKLTGTNLLDNNAQNGLYIRSNGSIFLNNIVSSFNGNDGVQISNNVDLVKPQGVTISGTNVFNGNPNTGLEIYSYGAIKLSNITANNNASGYGAYLDNEGYNSGLGGATVIARAPVTLTGVNTFNNNLYSGLQVNSVGAITISNVTAGNNGVGSFYEGVYLSNSDNWYPNLVTTPKPYAANVTLSGFGTFENNGYDGLSIFSKGALKLANLTANNNYNNGAIVETIGSLAPQSVTLSGTNTFYNNGLGTGFGDGLYVYNDGKITISNLSANNNTANGAYLNNFSGAWLNKFQGVTLTGSNTFQNNLMDGLYITTDGSATVSHINADENIQYGVNVIATRNVTLMCASAYSNSTGFYLWSGATMTLTSVQGYYNGANESLAHYATLKRTYACP